TQSLKLRRKRLKPAGSSKPALAQEEGMEPSSKRVSCALSWSSMLGFPGGGATGMICLADSMTFASCRFLSGAVLHAVRIVARMRRFLMLRVFDYYSNVLTPVLF